MILKKNDRTLYGIPYQGSKTKIISEIAKSFPNKENFYDLFGGGFSVSHYMFLHRGKSYKHFHYNELRPGLCELIQDAIAGKYNYDVFKPEWISREKFFAEKETNAYIKIIWSFGNTGEDYLFGKEIEQEKRSLHQAVIFDEFDSFMYDVFKLKQWPNRLTITGKRLYLRRVIASLKNKRCDLQQLEQLERLQQLEQLERLQQLEQLEQLEQLSFTNLDYREVHIKKDSIIYCDIPYQSTADYGNSFSHLAFFDWAHEQKEPVFISEYDIKDKRFFFLKEIKHRTTFSSTKNEGSVIERLYCNQSAYDLLQSLR